MTIPRIEISEGEGDLIPARMKDSLKTQILYYSLLFIPFAVSTQTCQNLCTTGSAPMCGWAVSEGLYGLTSIMKNTIDSFARYCLATSYAAMEIYTGKSKSLEKSQQNSVSITFVSSSVGKESYGSAEKSWGSFSAQRSLGFPEIGRLTRRSFSCPRRSYIPGSMVCIMSV